MTKQDKFVLQLTDDIINKVKHNKRSLEKLAASFGITDKTQVKELSELAIVRVARNLVEIIKGTEATYKKIVELYDTQYSLNMRTSHSMLLQQYSTPAPISYLASEYVNKHSAEALYFEPSAGNGLLTIALPYKQTIVNEIDQVRHDNLKRQAFLQVKQMDATKPIFDSKIFDGVVTNPPFATLDEPIKAGGFLIKHLDHAMAINALDTMKDSGKAAIIVGGHSTYDTKGRLTKGKNRIFLNYLYHHYQVEDVISIDGKKLYAKQGTGFNVRLILINGRKAKPEGAAPLKNETLTRVVTSYAELWDRVGLKEQEVIPSDLELELELEAEAIMLMQMEGLSGIKNDILAFVNETLSNKSNEEKEISLGKVTLEDSERIKEATGINVAGYERKLYNYEVKHTMNTHGNKKTEAARGQIAVTKEDFSLIPEIVSSASNIVSAEKTKIGTDAITYAKTIKDQIFYVEEIRTGRKVVTLKTMYKRKAP